MTTDGTPDPDQIAVLQSLAVELARGAAELVRTQRAAGVQVWTKSTVTDLVTATDRASERWLVERIVAARPEDAILGEEGAERPGSSGVRWVLDPIDGTVNFVLGLPQYAVSVAAELDGVVVAGAVCNPQTGDLYEAGLGGGAFVERPSEQRTRLTGPRSVPLGQAVVGTGFSYDASRRRRQIAVVAQLLPQIADIRRMGSASLDLCQVAAGRLDAYFEAGLSPWDYAAGALIAAEAGCVITGLRGREVSGALAAAAGADLAPDLLALLERLDADSV
ncbi:MAG: inositol monophosphatase family protein [Jatrophihabitantaceae bacterium]